MQSEMYTKALYETRSETYTKAIYEMHSEALTKTHSKKELADTTASSLL
jgi:hypothetical protein